MRRGAGIAGNPVLIGAATMLVVLVAVFLAYNANQGLPFVPTYELKAEVPSAANLVGRQRRAHRRLARRLRQRDRRRAPATTARPIAVLTLTLEQRRRAAAARLDADHPPALGARPQVRRDHARHGRARATTTAPRSRSPPPRRRPSSSTRSSTCSTTTTRAAIAANTTGFGDAFAGRGESINTAIGAFRPLLRDIVPVAQNLSAPETDLRRFFRRARRHGGDRGARGRGPGRAVRQPRHRRSARCARSPPVHPGLDHRAASRRSTPAIRELPDPAAVPAQHASCCSASCAGRRGAAHVRADDRRRARGGHARCCRARRRSTAGSRRCSRSCSASPRTRWSRAACSADDDGAEHAATRRSPT